MLKYATVIEDHSKEDEVGLNKKVECLFIDDDETETYKIVTPIRGDTMENRISIESPLGKTLLRHHVGDIVHVTTEAGGYDLKILSITPDDTDDEIRSF
jgi:transcription elongation factor GreA